MASTSIEWTHPPGFRGAAWNPTKGCRHKSPGCLNCYAEVMAGRIVVMGGPAAEKYRLTVKYDEAGKPRRRWSGVIVEDAEALAIPLRTKAPTCFFVDSMSDLFDASFEFIAAVFGVMAACPQHRFLVLTKSAEQMAQWFAWIASRARQAAPSDPDSAWWPVNECVSLAGKQLGSDPMGAGAQNWPLPNVWIGVSVEDQQRADERIPHLLSVPAAVRFLSCEPLLERVDLAPFLRLPLAPGNVWRECVCAEIDPADRPCVVCEARTGVDWVIVGGESGHGARRFDVEWARSIVKQCRAAGVPVFVKQMGAFVVDRNDRFNTCADTGAPEDWWPLDDPDAVEENINGYREEYQGAPVRIRLASGKGGDPAEWPADLRVREYPAAVTP